MLKNNALNVGFFFFCKTKVLSLFNKTLTYEDKFFIRIRIFFL